MLASTIVGPIIDYDSQMAVWRGPSTARLAGWGFFCIASTGIYTPTLLGDDAVTNRSPGVHTYAGR